MRKILASVALENQNIVKPFKTLSLEEEQLVMAEANEINNEVENGLSEADRLTDVVDTLEDLAVVTDKIEEATPVELNLIDAVASMAVAGSEVDSEKVIPAMESFKGKKIATESFVQRAKDIWATVQRFLAKIRDNIILFFKKMFSTIPNLQQKVSDLQKKLETRADDNTENNIEILAGISYLSVDGSVSKDQAELLKNLKDLQKLSEEVFVEYPRVTTAFSNAVVAGMHDFDPADPEVAATKAVKALSTAVSAISANATKKQHFLGNSAVAVNVELVKTSNPHAQLASYLNFKAKVEKSTKATETSSVKYTAFSKKECKDLLDTAEKILSAMDKFDDIFKHDIEKASKAVEDATKAMATKQTAFESTEKDSAKLEKAHVMYRTFADFNKTITHQMNSPYSALISNNVSVINTILMAVNKSMVGLAEK